MRKAYETWLQKGILKLGDIMNEQGQFLTMEQISTKYSVIINIMSYNSLIHAIPTRWKCKLRQTNMIHEVVHDELLEPKLQINNKLLAISAVNNKLIYWHLIRQYEKQPTSIAKWISEFPFLHDNDFKKFFILPYQIVRDTRIQTFQCAI